MSGEGFTESEVAERVGTTPQTIRRLAELGILEPEGERYPARAVLRARVVLDLDRMEIDADAVGQAYASGDLPLGYVETVRSTTASVQFGRSRTWARNKSEFRFRCCSASMWRSAFLGPKRTSWFGKRTTQLVIAIPVLFGAGVSEGEILRMARVWGDSARKVSQFQTHYLHHSIEEPFRAKGPPGQRGVRGTALREVAVRAGRSGEDPAGLAVPAPLGSVSS